MTDPGYGPNGQRLETSGLISFEANSPPTMFTIGDEVWNISPLGIRSIPFINQLDNETSSFIYLGGV